MESAGQPCSVRAGLVAGSYIDANLPFSGLPVGGCDLTLTPAIEAEGREAVREIVATGGGVGVVSAAEFGQDPRLVPLRLSDCELLMDEALVCLRERAGSKVIRAFFETVREVAAAQ